MRHFYVKYTNSTDWTSPLDKSVEASSFIDCRVEEGASHLEDRIEQLEELVKILLKEVLQVRGTDFDIRKFTEVTDDTFINNPKLVEK